MLSRHKPPSRARYEARNPTASARIPQELASRIKQVKELNGISVGDLLRQAPGKHEPLMRQAYDRGFADAKRCYAVTFTCRTCGMSVEVTSEGDRQKIGDIAAVQAQHCRPVRQPVPMTH